MIGGSGESGTVCMRSCLMFIFSWLASVCSRRALKTSKSPWASKGLHAAMVIMHNDQIKSKWHQHPHVSSLRKMLLKGRLGQDVPSF